MRRIFGERRRDERGAVATVAGVFVVVIMVIAALVVDIGMQRVLRADLQALADVVALDLARELDGRPAGSYNGVRGTRMDAARDASVRRNSDVIGGPVDPRGVTWELVKRDPTGSQWVPAEGGDVPAAVKVIASAEVGFVFGGVTGEMVGGATRTAVGQARTSACLRVSSYAAHVDTGQSWLLDALLGKVLGTRLAVQVLDPHAGLLGAQVSLLELIEELDPLVATDISALSFTEAADVVVNLERLMLAALHALERRSGQVAQVQLMRGVYDGVRATIGAVGVRLADIVSLETAADAALGLDLDLLDLVAGSLAVANGTNVIDLPLGVTLPLPLGGRGSAVDLRARVVVGQKPVVKCGGTAESSQVVVELYGDAVDVDLGLVSAHVPVSVRLTLADASATVTDVRCLPHAKRVLLDIDSGLASLEVRLGRMAGQPSSPEMRVALADVGLPGWNGIEVARGTIALTSGQSMSRPTLHRHIDVVDEDYSRWVRASEGGIGIPTLHTSLNTLALLDGLGPVSFLLRFLGISNLLDMVVREVVEGVVNPLVHTADRWLLSPLLRTLGIDVAGGTVHAAPTVDCGVPRLVG
ncbi:putative membrane protein [Nocardioides thalensis]|uniref:Putative membrane protein n=1 Tax=Nocardioides thalensis TaxID=1914755 RepID=A0A853C367_9ACTN|nr:pilus assembly protein TadG-related protein [Nocardioides thalensis]NYJ01132.1 putative membrane protein [Nocardioides thalensis]